MFYKKKGDRTAIKRQSKDNKKAIKKVIKWKSKGDKKAIESLWFLLKKKEKMPMFYKYMIQILAGGMGNSSKT